MPKASAADVLLQSFAADVAAKRLHRSLLQIVLHIVEWLLQDVLPPDVAAVLQRATEKLLLRVTGC